MRCTRSRVSWLSSGALLSAREIVVTLNPVIPAIVRRVGLPFGGREAGAAFFAVGRLLRRDVGVSASATAPPRHEAPPLSARRRRQQSFARRNTTDRAIDFKAGPPQRSRGFIILLAKPEDGALIANAGRKS